MFSEDSPYLASFSYCLHGFKDPPTDHYARPFWLETYKLFGGVEDHWRPCLNSGKVSIDEPVVQETAALVVSHINKHHSEDPSKLCQFEGDKKRVL